MLVITWNNGQLPWICLWVGLAKRTHRRKWKNIHWVINQKGRGQDECQCEEEDVLENWRESEEYQCVASDEVESWYDTASGVQEGIYGYEWEDLES